MQTLIMHVIKEQKLIATGHSFTPHPARSGGGGGGGVMLAPGLCL